MGTGIRINTGVRQALASFIGIVAGQKAAAL
jgi:hypothetical protein